MVRRYTKTASGLPVVVHIPEGHAIGRTEIADQVTGYRWVVMGLWFLGSVTGIMVVFTMGILLPTISSELSLSPNQQGFLGSAAFWGNLALAIPLSWWASRYSPKLLTTVTLVLGTPFLFLQGWAPVFWVLIVGRLAFGLFLLAREPAKALLIQQWFPVREIVLVNGVSNALFGLVVGGGLIATPFVLSSFGNDWRPTLHVFGIFLVVLTLLWMVLGRERVTGGYQEDEAPHEAGVLRNALMHRDLWLAGFGFLGSITAWSAFLSFFPTLMLDTHQVSLKWSGTILALGIFVGGIAGLAIAYAVMKTGKRRSILQVAGIVLVATYVGMALTGSIPLLVVLSLLNGVVWGVWPVLETVPFELPGIRPREVAIALAFLKVMIAAGSVLGPLAMGVFQEAFGDLRLALLVISFAALSMSIAGTLLRPVPEEMRAEQEGVTYQG